MAENVTGDRIVTRFNNQLEQDTGTAPPAPQPPSVTTQPSPAPTQTEAEQQRQAAAQAEANRQYQASMQAAAAEAERQRQAAAQAEANRQYQASMQAAQNNDNDSSGSMMTDLQAGQVGVLHKINPNLQRKAPVSLVHLLRGLLIAKAQALQPEAEQRVDSWLNLTVRNLLQRKNNLLCY
jgi:type IV secretory pathway VirB10-like protein